MGFIKYGLISLFMAVSFSAMAESSVGDETVLESADLFEQELIAEGYNEESYKKELEDQEAVLDFLGLSELQDVEVQGRRNRADRGRGHRHGDRHRRGKHHRRGDRHRRGKHHRRGDHHHHRRHRRYKRHHRRDCHFWGTCRPYRRYPHYRHVCVVENQWGEIFRGRAAWPSTAQDKALNKCYSDYSTRTCYTLGCHTVIR